MRQDDAFWHTAYCSHGPAVLAFLRRRVGREEAEDVLQETFVRAIRAGTFRGDDGNARAYLMSTARHVLINRLRRPRLVVPADELASRARGDDHPGRDALAEVPANDATPEQNAAWSAFNERLDSVLTELKEAHRQAFEVRDRQLRESKNGQLRKLRVATDLPEKRLRRADLHARERRRVLQQAKQGL